MAKSRTYIVSLTPAERQSWGGYSITLSLVSAAKDHELVAADYTELALKVVELAQQFGKTCSPYIRLKDKRERKPRGFDKFTRTMSIVEVEASPAANVAA